MTNPIHVKNQELESVILKQYQEITDLVQQRDSLVTDIEQLHKSVNDLEKFKQDNKSQKAEIDFLTLSLASEKEIVFDLNKKISDLDLKLHKIGQT